MLVLLAALSCPLLYLPQAEPAPIEGVALIRDDLDSGWWAGDREAHARLEQLSEAQIEAIAAENREAVAEAWGLEDGILSADGGELGLYTYERFANFELSVEFQVGEMAIGGVYLRGRSLMLVLDAESLYPPGLAFGALNDGGGLYPGYQGSGGLAYNTRWSDGRLPAAVADRPRGEWNELRLTLVGERLTAWLNGVLVHDGVVVQNEMDSRLGMPVEGPLGLGCWRGPIRWRALTLRPLDHEESIEHLTRLGGEGWESLGTGPGVWGGDTEVWKLGEEVLSTRDDSSGVIFTERRFDDFQLDYQFRIPPSGSHFGLTLRYPGEGDPSKTSMGQVLHLARGDPRKLRPRGARSTGEIERMVSAREDPTVQFPDGEWNHGRVTVRRHTVGMELNGCLVSFADLALLDSEVAPLHKQVGRLRESGSVGWMAYGRPAEIRAVRVRELEEPWPGIEPFAASRFWEMVLAYSGVAQDERQTPGSLAAMSELFGLFSSAADAGHEAGAKVAAEMGEPVPAPPPPAAEPSQVTPPDPVAWALVPVVVEALRPLWDDEDWDAEDVKLASAAAERIAPLKGAPQVEFSLEAGATNHLALRSIADWYRGQIEDVHTCAQMVFTLDEGPWLPIPIEEDSTDRQVEGRVQIDQHNELRVLAKEPGEDCELEISRGGRVVSRFRLTEVPHDHVLGIEYARPPVRLGDQGWLVEMSFGVPGDIEILSLYLGPAMEPRFYFASW